MPRLTLTRQLTIGVILFLLVRPAIPVFLAYDRNVSPLAGIDMWTPLRMIGYTIALDLPFYCYHRMTHELNSLWWVHRLVRLVVVRDDR